MKEFRIFGIFRNLRERLNDLLNLTLYMHFSLGRKRRRGADGEAVRADGLCSDPICRRDGMSASTALFTGSGVVVIFTGFYLL
jgi:hypothetical protein